MALQGPGVLQMVNIMGEHENGKIPQSPFISDLSALVWAGRYGIVMDIVLGGPVKFTGTAVLGPADHLEAVTKIEMFKCLGGVLP